MTKNDLINEVVAIMINEIGIEKSNLLKNILLTKMHHIELVISENLPSVDVFDNKWILERFAIDQMAKGLKKSTIEQYLWIMKKFFNETGLCYKYVKAQDITDYLAIRQYKDHISQSYKATTRRYISAFFVWAYRKKHIDSDIMLDVDSIKVPKKTKQRLSDEEVEICRSVASSNQEHTAILETMLNTGVRVGELKHLKVSDLNFNDGTIRIWGEKSSQERIAFMTPRFKVAVKAFLEDRKSGYLFCQKNKKMRSNKYFEDIAKYYGQLSGSSVKCTVHIYRKTFASITYRKTKDILLVSKLLGHASTETTIQHYLVDDVEDMKLKVLNVA